MTLAKPLSAVIVGCGSIGALKPDKYDKPYGENILTHAHAYIVSPDVDLTGVIDVDEEKAATAAKKWGVNLCSTELDTIQEMAPDIVSVCSPTSTHFRILKKLLEYTNWKPGLVIAEKPFCESVVQAKAIRKLYKDANIPLVINYTRRYSLDYQFLQRMITDGTLGEIYHARLLYGRGLLRDGCHGLDLYNWFFGKLVGVLVNNIIYDYLPNDPTISLYLKYEKCVDAQLIAVDSRKCGLFEMDIVSEKGIYRLAEYGRWFYFYEATAEKTYGDYKSIPGTPKDARISDITNALSRLIANAANHLLLKEGLNCTVDDAVGVHEIMDAVNQVCVLTEKRRKEKEPWAVQ